MNAVKVPIIAMLLLVGCATPSMMLVNDKGQVIRCASYGYGYVGAPMAAAIYDQCVRDYQKVGYVELPDVKIGFYAEFSQGRATITRIVPGDPAELSGMKPGDVITQFDGAPIGSSRSLADILHKHQAGDVVTVLVERDGQQLELKPALQAR